MSEISERCYFAGWLNGTEDVLWGAVTMGPRDWGRGRVRSSDLAELRELSSLAGGWVIWRDGDGLFEAGTDLMKFESPEFVDRYGAAPAWARSASGRS